MPKSRELHSLAFLDLVGTKELLLQNEGVYASTIESFYRVICAVHSRMSKGAVVEIFAFSDSVLFSSSDTERLLGFIRKLRLECLSLSTPPLLFKCGVSIGKKDWHLQIRPARYPGSRVEPESQQDLDRVVFGPLTVSAYLAQEKLKAIGVTLPTLESELADYGVKNVQFATDQLADCKLYTDLAWAVEDIQNGMLSRLQQVVRMVRLRIPQVQRYYISFICCLMKSLTVSTLTQLYKQHKVDGVSEMLEFVKHGKFEELFEGNDLRACIYVAVLTAIYDAFNAGTEIPRGLIEETENYLVQLPWLQTTIRSIPTAFFSEEHRCRYYGRVLNMA